VSDTSQRAAIHGLSVNDFRCHVDFSLSGPRLFRPVGGRDLARGFQSAKAFPNRLIQWALTATDFASLAGSVETIGLHFAYPVEQACGNESVRARKSDSLMSVPSLMANDSRDLGIESSSRPLKLKDLEHSSCGLVSDGRAGDVYNEEAFRYFLEIERKRSELSTRPLLLLLIDLKKQPATDGGIDPISARKLFTALSPCVRETDFIGWYRHGRVAGAVLTQHADATVADVPDIVCQRIVKALRDTLPSAVAKRLQVRAYQLPANARDRN
jgi:hypothetical protein